MEDSPVNEVDLGPLGNDQPIGNTLHFVLPQRDMRAFTYDHDSDCLGLALDCVATRLHLRTRHGRQPACLRFGHSVVQHLPARLNMRVRVNIKS